MRHDRSESRCRSELSRCGQRFFLTAHFQITGVIPLAPASNAAESYESAIDCGFWVVVSTALREKWTPRKTLAESAVI
jgi:hypothetical protein